MKIWINNSYRSIFTYALGTLFLVSTQVLALEVQVAEAPSTNLELILNAIQSAKKSVFINIYEMTSPHIVEAIVEEINKGIEVQILQEGQPVGGLSKASKQAQTKILNAMHNHAKTRYYMMKSSPGIKRRFRFNHAKYIVIDKKSVVVGSENYSPTGHPAPGVRGNRGWEVWVKDSDLAQEFTKLFLNDSDTSNDDIIDLKNNGTEEVVQPDETWNVSSIRNFANARPKTLQAHSVNAITSPDTSLSGLVKTIESANQSLDIELLSFDSQWASQGASPLLEALVEAARHQVKVRVLLNDESVFQNLLLGFSFTAKAKNPPTAKELNAIAKTEGLNMSARIANLKAMGVTYIHNKGLLADQDKTLISSINWNQNSVQNNRETAVLIESQQVHDYFETYFEKDWKVSAQ